MEIRAVSDTPRTDAVMREYHGQWGATALLEHARQLERETDAMREARDLYFRELETCRAVTTLCCKKDRLPTEALTPNIQAATAAAIEFGKGLRYLGHPEVRDYRGTANGDSPEAWERDYVATLCGVILAAAAFPSPQRESE